MKKFGNLICKHKILVLIITILLIIPSIIGYIKTDINYDILVYLPSDIETLKGEEILTDDFNMGAFAIVTTENMSDKQINKLENEYRKIQSVQNVISLTDIVGTNIPIEILPQDVIKSFANGNDRIILVTFKNSTSNDITLDAVSKMREVSDDNIQIGGMSALVLDTKELFNSEMLLYVVIAVIFCLIVLEFSLDSYIVPILLLLNIGIAIIFNMGSNIVFGEISYITKAIAAVLQLGVTTDFSIFLYHRYEKEKQQTKDIDIAMSIAIHDTFVSVFGSSLTTIAGFLALCTMKLTLGTDIGLVMAKGVIIGVICVLTVFPALLLVFDKLITKAKHKELLPRFGFVSKFVTKNYIVIFIIFLILLMPFYMAQRKTDVYYKLDKSIPEDYGYQMATKKIQDEFGLISQEILLVNNSIPDYKINEMIEEINEIDGIDKVISPTSLSKYGISNNIIPSNLQSIYQTDNYKMILILSNYDIATDELNKQVEQINNIIKEYDENIILAGEGPLMKDLVTTADIDLKNVNYVSILAIFIIMAIVLKSISLPILLVLSIELAIFINMGIPYFNGTSLPFIAGIVIGTIQLGATIDYAILLTTKYLTVRQTGEDKYTSITNALNNCSKSIFVSAMCFFAATIGVGFISKIDLIASLCILMARGAIISMLVVLLVVPSILLIFDKVIMKTTYLKKEGKKMKKNKKIQALLLGIILFLPSIVVNALTKEETVYGVLNADGSQKSITVSEHLINNDSSNVIEDLTDLTDIVNTNSNKKYTLNGNNLTWNADGTDIYYKGVSNSKLPIMQKITYKLDGQEINLEDLLGKSGKVEITINYNNISSKVVKINNQYETLYTPFVVALTTNFSNSNYKNITINNGEIIDNGLGYTIIALASPGLYNSLGLDSLKDFDSIIITMDTTKFELPNIYSVITPKLIDINDLNIFSKINTTLNSISTLQSSMNQIVQGSSLIADNLNIVSEKMQAISAGTISVDNGLKQIISELQNASSLLNTATNTEKIDQMQQLIKVNEETIDLLSQGNALVKEKYELYQLSSVSYTDIEAMPIAQEDKISLVNVKYNYENTYSTNEKLINLLTNDNIALGSSVDTFKTTSEQIEYLINTLNVGLTKLESGASDIALGSNSLSEAVTILDGKTSELSSGIKEFNEQGINKLSTFALSANLISNKIEYLNKLSDEYQSFSLTEKNVQCKTKFILVINGQKLKEETKEISQEKTKDSFFTKLKNLFE